MAEETRDKLVAWLASAGYIVAPAEQGLPPQASWGLMVATPPPVQVKMRIIGLRNGAVIAGIGVNFADVHRREIMKLEPAERSSFVAGLLSGIIQLCPYCRVALQGGMLSPEAVVAEILYAGDTLSKQRVIDDMARLVNIFMYINMELWRRFPEAHIKEGGGTQPSTGFM